MLFTIFRNVLLQSSYIIHVSSLQLRLIINRKIYAGSVEDLIAKKEKKKKERNIGGLIELKRSLSSSSVLEKMRETWNGRLRWRSWCYCRRNSSSGIEGWRSKQKRLSVHLMCFMEVRAFFGSWVVMVADCLQKISTLHYQNEKQKTLSFGSYKFSLRFLKYNVASCHGLN